MKRLFLLLVASVFLAACGGDEQPADAAPAQIELGRTVYAENCASCHGENLEGEPNWQQPHPDGSFRSPPHDETGHTWHHDDEHLLNRIRYGTAGLPPEMQDRSSMPAYDETLSDEEIEAVLAYIKSTWPPDVQAAQQRGTH